MREMNEYTATVPFDLFELHLLHLVAEHHSFTKAAVKVGLTQSAITRQIQGMESRLGIPLLERTTRSVTLTPAGELLLEETRHILGDIQSSLRRLHEISRIPKIVRVGVSKTIALAYLPGFFFARQRKYPEIGIEVRHESSKQILAALEAGDLDAAVLCPPPILPDSFNVTHRFQDAFALIIPASTIVPVKIGELLWTDWLNNQKWLLIDDQSNTGAQLRAWITSQGGTVRPSAEMDNFDLIIQLVGLGLGISLVPQRALASYPRKRTIRQLRMPNRFARELVVVTRRTARPVEHVDRFVENILF